MKCVIALGDVKPSQHSSILYKTWVAIQKDGAVLSGHCTCMAGILEVCNHVTGSLQLGNPRVTENLLALATQ